MSITVIARSRSRMYTAFIAEDGRRILNIALDVDGTQRCVSIAFDECEDAALSLGDAGAVERIVRDGRRVGTVPTPPASIDVTPAFLRAA